jgi:ribulose 1,5-bisphosphate carboxylase large subunit-like protein
MIVQNPKREITVNFPIDKVKEAILKIQKKGCDVIKNDEILNEIVFHDKEKLGLGYHVSFTLLSKSENETNIIVEVSRNMTTLNTNVEVGIANNKLKRFVDEFSAHLSGNSANIPKQGCMLVAVSIITFAVCFIAFALVVIF